MYSKAKTCMRIIPAIDLKNERAVAAIRGERRRYLPLRSPLCPDGEPVGLLLRLTRYYHTIYLADIDALSGGDTQTALLNRIRRRFPTAEFWLDIGANADFPKGFTRIIGSESSPPTNWRGMVSLDYKDRRLLGRAPPAHRLPGKVVVINLANVGSGDPDLPHLQALLRKSGGRELLAGGGIGAFYHLRLLKNRGLGGALVAGILYRSILSAGAMSRLFLESRQHPFQHRLQRDAGRIGGDELP